MKYLYSPIAKQVSLYCSNMHFLSLLLYTYSCLFSASIAAADTTIQSLDHVPVLHFPLFRRGGKFEPTERLHDWTNLTYLAQELERTEARFNLTKREVKGNKLIRKGKINASGGKDAGVLMGEVAAEGIW